MVKLCALLVLLLVPVPCRAALVYLDANFASDTVAEDSTGLNVVQTLTANGSGTVWGGQVGFNPLWKVSGGVYTEYSVPGAGVGAVRTKDANTTYVGEYYVGSPSGSAHIYQVDANGNSTVFATLPADRARILKMSVSPVNGDVLVSVDDSPNNVARILKYNSSGTLQWDVEAPSGFQVPVAFNPSGEAFASGSNGELYSLDDATGSKTLLSAQVPAEYAGAGIGNIHDMVFSDDNNLFISTEEGNLENIVRTNLTTNETDLLAHWSFEVPSVARWLEYVDGQGLYINSFDAADLEFSLAPEFGPFQFGLNRSFNLSTSSASVLLLQGDFNGEFAGFSLASLVPEPSSAWLLLGLCLCWKRKLAHRHSPSGTVQNR